MIRFLSSVLFVSDIAASRLFYEELLGQKVEADFGLNVGFVGGFALWQSAHAQQTIASPEVVPPTPAGCGNCELYFETESLDEVWAKLAQAGVPCVHPIREQPWGQRVFRVFDPDRHLVDVGEPMLVVVRRFMAEGQTVEQIAARTFMPAEIVRTMAG
jgi:catechol 2,3-dioxygenase-like lactoylglutathione lyase family enzyme